jgi:CRP-like cAMP-binding protein
MLATKLSPELYQELKASSRILKSKKGAVLFQAGSPGHGAFLVRAGQIKLTLDGSPCVFPARLLGPGSLIGLPATVSGEPYSLTATVVKDAELDFITRDKMLGILRGNTTVALEILKVLSEEISHMRRMAKRAVRDKSRTVH